MVLLDHPLECRKEEVFLRGEIVKGCALAQTSTRRDILQRDRRIALFRHLVIGCTDQFIPPLVFELLYKLPRCHVSCLLSSLVTGLVYGLISGLISRYRKLIDRLFSL